MMTALRRALTGSLLALLVVTVAGCGPDMKAETDALKKQVADAQKQNGDLKGQVEMLAKENDSLKKQVAELQAKLKPPAKPPAKPAAKPAAPKK
jgi:cell division protein FtsB